MIILHVTIQVKPEHVAEFLEVVRYDAEHSEKDEAGCLRFDVIQDRDDANRFYFYEV
ncbi:MAG: putative quinol monooxygenase, partial [Candidatus Binatia bacterium]